MIEIKVAVHRRVEVGGIDSIGLACPLIHGRIRRFRLGRGLAGTWWLARTNSGHGKHGGDEARAGGQVGDGAAM